VLGGFVYSKMNFMQNIRLVAPSPIKRDGSIDAIKGFLILCVICGHYNYTLLGDTGPEKLAIFFNELIYLFHMPLFLVVSFIFIKKLDLETFKSYGEKILIPYCFWVFIFFQSVNTTNTIPNKFKAMFYGTYDMGTGLFWFLAVLFVCKVIMSFYLRVMVSKKSRYLFWFVFSAAWFLIYYFYPQLSDRTIVGLTPFNFIMCLYLFPMLFFVNRIYKSKLYWQHKISTLNLFFLMVATMAYLMFLSSPAPIHRVDLARFIIPHRLDLILVMVTLWAVLLLLLDRLFVQSNIIAKYLSRLGFYSLVIFIFHIPVKQFLEMHIIQAVPENMLWVRVLASLLVIFLVCEICILISSVVMRVSQKFKMIGMVSSSRQI
jgi:fucose 4-O-acetylase-like acetyltransferase